MTGISKEYPVYVFIREFSVFLPSTGKYEFAGYATQEKIDRMQNAKVISFDDWGYAEPHDLIDGVRWMKPYLARFIEPNGLEIPISLVGD